MYQIKNDQLSVCVSSVGAQLKSLYSHVTDMESLPENYGNKSSGIQIFANSFGQ